MSKPFVYIRSDGLGGLVCIIVFNNEILYYIFECDNFYHFYALQQYHVKQAK